jgi:Dolichyl-phosphate-mannose-protein mannosyltransferase
VLEGTRPHESTRGLKWALVGLALLVRLVHLAHVQPGPEFEYHKSFHESDMYMFDQWAHRIVAGDPLGREVYHPLNGWQVASAPLERWNEWYGDQPTFYKAPLYAYLIAGLYTLFADVMLPLALLQIAAAAASVWVLFGITERLWGREPAFFASLLLAIYAPAIHFDVVMLRGPWIVLVSLLATRELARLREGASSRTAVLLGMFVGLSLLFNEGFLTVPPLVLLAVPLLLPRGAPRLRTVGLVLLAMAVTLAPVVARNLAVGAPAFKLAVTGSTVYAVFNSASSSPYFFEARAAAFVPILAESGNSLGRAVLACLRSFPSAADVVTFYLHKASGLAIPFENPDNANFYYAALTDPVLAVLPAYGVLFPLALTGLLVGLRRGRSLIPLLPYAASLLVSILVAIPLSRYRVTLAVFFMPPAGLALAAGLEALRRRSYARLAAGLAFVAAVAAGGAAWQSEVVFDGRPAGMFLYRPPEFLLGADSYARKGRYGAALNEIMLLLGHNPDRSIRPTALLLAARIDLQRRDVAGARQALDLATDAADQDPASLMTIGDFQRDALRDEGRARAAYERALQLDPPPDLRAELARRLGSAP